jgi:sugar O-acyltransferase (sialic acid O-acetyltransferase NeuD family)
MIAMNSPSRVRAVIVSLDGDVLDLVDRSSQIEVLGFLDSSASATDRYHENLGNDSSWPRLVAEDPSLRVILAVDWPGSRAKLAAHYGVDRLLTIISPLAEVSRTANIGIGSIVQRGVAISRNSTVGVACKLNCGAQLHHDVCVGDYCTVAPGARLLGNVRVGRQSYIGSGAIVLPRIRIGMHAVIGAGAVVTRDVPDAVTAKGMPARW